MELVAGAGSYARTALPAKPQLAVLTPSFRCADLSIAEVAHAPLSLRRREEEAKGGKESRQHPWPSHRLLHTEQPPSRRQPSGMFKRVPEPIPLPREHVDDILVEPTPEARLVSIVQSFKADGSDVVLMGVPRPRTLSIAGWPYTNRVIERVARFTGSAFVPTLPLYDEPYFGTENEINYPGPTELDVIGRNLVKLVV